LTIVKTKKWEYYTLAIVLVWAGGYWLQPFQWSLNKLDEKITVSLVQGGIDQGQKWDEDKLIPTAQLYYDLTSSEFGRDLIIWPEAALPHLRHVLENIYDELRDRALEEDSTLVLGSIEYDFDKDQYFNGILMLGEPDQVYYKRHLVPFGEYFPVPQLIRNWLRLKNLPYMDYTPGKSKQSLLTKNGEYSFAPLLCYEAAYGAEQLYAFPAASFLVNVSNDGWFGDSIAADQHLQIARLRAQETQRPLLRATNNGITAVIDQKGDISAQLPQFEPGVLRSEITLVWGHTPYTWWGNWPVLFVVFLSILGLWRSWACEKTL
ncbi:MAG: apolipoprotein N-acyltransferase, partial [Gammaproteobacteria bacterium]|nr:apolipoprotein N-acyltransferase [Gammaproteobacteria bacterium]